MSIGMQCPQGHQLGPDDTVCPTCGTLAVTQGERMPLPSASIYPTIPGYRIVEELGRGGMGVVYRAEHLELKRQVALKMILAGALAGPRDLTRFRDEAEAMARFHHPRILQIYHVGEIDGNPFLTLELAEGGTLARKSGGKPQPPHEAAALVESLAQAVHAAHEHGIIHRDLKPANILLDAKGAPKISDFGLAKQMDQADDRTATGAILGTPSYMAPEQARGKSKSQAIGPAADVYALGAILYDLLTGRPPFLGESPVDTLQQVLGQEPVPPTRLQPKVSPELEGICLHCLEKQPSLRYPSAQALADDLRRFQNHEPTLVRPVSPWGRLRKWARRRPAAAALIGVILAALTALFLMGFFYNLELQNALANIGLEKQATTAARLEIDKEKTATNLARQEVEQQKNATASARKDVDQQKEATAAAQEEADYNLYLSQIILADSQFHANRVAFAEQALGKCPPRLRGWEWRYLKLLCHAEVMTLLGPTASVTALAFSNDHQRLAVASWDGAIYVFNPQSGAMVHYLRGHIGPVNAVAYHPEGTVLAAAAGLRGEDDSQIANRPGEVRIWDAYTGILLQVLEGHRGSVNWVGYSPNGKYLATASQDKTIKVYHAVSGEVVANLSNPTDGFRRAAFSPDGKFLAAIDDGRTLRLWNTATWKLASAAKRFSGNLKAMAFSPDGKNLALNGRGGNILVLSLPLLKEEATIGDNTSMIHGLAYSPMGDLLAAACDDQTVRVWSVEKQELVAVWRGHTSRVMDVAFSLDRKWLASAGYDRTVKLWDPAGQPDVRVIHKPKQTFQAVAVSPDGQTIASGGMIQANSGKWYAGPSTQSVVTLWNPPNDKARRTLRGNVGPLWGLAFDPVRPQIAGAGSGGVTILDINSGKEIRRLTGNEEPIWSVAYDAAGRSLAAGGHDGVLRIYEATTGKMEHGLTGHSGSIDCVAFSPDGSWIATAGFDHSVKVWNARTGKIRHHLAKHTAPVMCVAFHPKGRFLASAGLDGVIRLWDLETGREHSVLADNAGPVWALTFTQDGRRLASATGSNMKSFFHKNLAKLGNLGSPESSGTTIRIWDVAKNRQTLTLRAPESNAAALHFTSLGDFLVLGAEYDLRLWDARPLRAMHK